MSLRHGALGLLSSGPASGYDLLKLFDISLANVWSATQSQLYGELNKLAGEGLIEVSAVGPRGRKEYSITDAGRLELHRWLTTTEPERPRRHDAYLRTFFLWTLPKSEARAYLESEHARYAAELEHLQGLADGIRWSGEGFDWSSRMALEAGLRTTKASLEWTEWALEQVDRRPAARHPKKGVAIHP